MDFTATGYARDLFSVHIPGFLTKLGKLADAQAAIAEQMRIANELKAEELRASEGARKIGMYITADLKTL